MKPILFNTDMVRALLTGRKTVTRRAMKPQPPSSSHPNLFVSPPYRPGDILYVRETFCPFDADHMVDGVEYAYRADATPESERVRQEYGYKWRPSIHMPREAARIFLRVTDVRVERLQDISSDGCIKEGVPYEDVIPEVPSFPDIPFFDMDEVIGDIQDREEAKLIAHSFGGLWNSTIKPADRALYSWEANPWVWVIEFERIGSQERPSGPRTAAAVWGRSERQSTWSDRGQSMKETLCWTCQRAGTSTCSWDARLEPVKGWTAENVRRRWKKHAGFWETFMTYNVEMCPLYIQDNLKGRPLGCHTPNKINLEELERLLNQGYTADQCAELLDVCVSAIYKHRRKIMEGNLSEQREG